LSSRVIGVILEQGAAVRPARQPTRQRIREKNWTDRTRESYHPNSDFANPNTPMQYQRVAPPQDWRDDLRHMLHMAGVFGWRRRNRRTETV